MLQTYDYTLESVNEPYANEPIDHQDERQEAERDERPGLPHELGEQPLPRQKQRR